MSAPEPSGEVALPATVGGERWQKARTSENASGYAPDCLTSIFALLRRLVCRLFGHRWRHVAVSAFRGTGFVMCWRCGRLAQ